VLVPADAAAYRVDAVGPAPPTDAPLPPQSAAEDVGSEAEVLARLAELIENIGARLDTLMEAVAPFIGGAGVGKDPPLEGGAAEGIKAARDALIYTAFFQEAVRLGMSPAMVSDAYQLADLAYVTADLETRDVAGVGQAAEALLENKPYLFAVRPADVGSETNPAKGPSSYPQQVESLARALGVSPDFAAELVKKRSDKAGNGLGLSEIWRVPRGNRLSYLQSNE